MVVCLISCRSTLCALCLGSACDCGLCRRQRYLEIVGSLRPPLSSGLTAPFLIRLALDVVSGWRTQAAEGFAGVGLGFEVYEGRASVIAYCQQLATRWSMAPTSAKICRSGAFEQP